MVEVGVMYGGVVVLLVVGGFEFELVVVLWEIDVVELVDDDV